MTRKLKICDRIRRLIHIWRIWRAVVIFYKNQSLNAYYNSLEYAELRRVEEDNKEIKEATENNFFHNQVGRTAPLKIPRYNFFADLLEKYGNYDEKHYADRSRFEHGMIPSFNSESATKAIFINGLINDCIKSGFIDTDKQDKNLLYLTSNGLKFVTFSYFLKYTFTELEVVFKWWWSIVTLVIGFAGSKIVEMIISYVQK